MSKTDEPSIAREQIVAGCKNYEDIRKDDDLQSPFIGEQRQRRLQQEKRRRHRIDPRRPAVHRRVAGKSSGSDNHLLHPFRLTALPIPSRQIVRWAL